VSSRKTLEERFWAKVRRSEHGCWIWTGSQNSRGYGLISSGGTNSRTLYAHRVSYELTRGTIIPPNMDILHLCDNPPCVRPDHLQLGTRLDNIMDMLRKGRYNARKLTDDNIREILERMDVPGTVFAEKFGVSKSLISKVRSFRISRYVE